MTCKNCPYRAVGWVASRPEESWCIGVKHPFKIDDINMKCTEYPNASKTTDSQELIKFTVDLYQPPKFIMLVGIPGSGKSFRAATLSAVENTVHISSDAIRKRIYGDENCQKDPGRVFHIMYEETIEALRNGISVVYDATNVSRKNRKEILDRLPCYVVKECVVCWAPIDVCIERDANRERTVGPAVIDKIVRRFEAPFYDEGFDSITVSIGGISYDAKQYYSDLLTAIEIPHDNPHHTLGVREPCRMCGENLLNADVPSFVVKAGFIHDIGKAYTKTFVNRKGDTTDIAHYYDHQAVGAWLSYGINGHSPTLAWLISTHMAPFINQKYYNSLDPLYKKWIDVLHKADVEAH